MSKPAPTALCIDCAHCIIDHKRPNDSRCNRWTADQKVNPVSGDRSQRQHPYCEVERMYSGRCGREGREWKLRPPEWLIDAKERGAAMREQAQRDRLRRFFSQLWAFVR